MSLPAWRPVLAAALACLLPATLPATEAPGAAPASRASYSSADPADTADPKNRTNPSDLSPTPSPSPKITRPPAPDIDALGRMLGYLTLFAAIAGATVYFVKFGLPLVRKNALAERKLQILETRPLGNRQYLLVVGYEDTRLLLGVTPGKIDYLCPLESPTASKDFGAFMASAENQHPSS